MIILLAGTSGTGKSTLASLLASKMGITTIVSTDSIRHMLRSFTTEAEDPVLWASTYQVSVPCPSITHSGSCTTVLRPPCLGQSLSTDLRASTVWRPASSSPHGILEREHRFPSAGNPGELQTWCRTAQETLAPECNLTSSTHEPTVNSHE